MPLIQVIHRQDVIPVETLIGLQRDLPAVAAEALSCEEGGTLSPKDITLEFGKMNYLDTNCKDIHVRVWAHDYPSRRGENLAALDNIRRRIVEEVLKHLPPGVSWYVWVLLVPTSYYAGT